MADPSQGDVEVARVTRARACRGSQAEAASKDLPDDDDESQSSESLGEPPAPPDLFSEAVRCSELPEYVASDPGVEFAEAARLFERGAADAKKNKEDRSSHQKMLECIEELQAERVKGNGVNLVKMIPSFVAMTGRSGEVYHLHPCRLRESSARPQAFEGWGEDH